VKAWFLELILSVGTGGDMQYLVLQMPSQEACEFTRDKAVISTTTVEMPERSGAGVETEQRVSLRGCFRASIDAIEKWRPGDPKVYVEQEGIVPDQ
jgi:hypothetical protein